MQITNATITFGRTVKPADYEAKKVEVVLTGIIGNDDEMDALGHMAHAQAMRMLALPDRVVAPQPVRAETTAPLPPPAPPASGAPVSTIPPASAVSVPPAPAIAPTPTPSAASGSVAPPQPAPAPGVAAAPLYNDVALGEVLSTFCGKYPTQAPKVTEIIKEFPGLNGAIGWTQIPMERRVEFVGRIKALETTLSQIPT